MLLVDDVVGAPMKGVLWVFKKVHEAAVEAEQEEGEAITAELTRLYEHLEKGEISEATFDEKELELLDRLEAFERRQGSPA